MKAEQPAGAAWAAAAPADALVLRKPGADAAAAAPLEHLAPPPQVCVRLFSAPLSTPCWNARRDRPACLQEAPAPPQPVPRPAPALPPPLAPLALTADEEAALRVAAVRRILHAERTPAQHFRAAVLARLATSCAPHPAACLMRARPMSVHLWTSEA